LAECGGGTRPESECGPQVSVAVLLDNFVSVSMRMEADDKLQAAREKRASSQFQSPLEPLVAKLANEYTDGPSLTSKLAALFHVRTPPRRAATAADCVWGLSLRSIFIQPRYHAC
jgi:hypothetical protein